MFKYFKIFFLASILICFGFQQKPETDSVSYYTKKQKPLKVINFLNKKEEEYQDSKQYKLYCTVLIQKATQLLSFDDSQGALDALYKARKVAEEQNLQITLADIHYQISKINKLALEYSKANKNIEKTIKIATENNNKEFQLIGYQVKYGIHFDTNSDSTFFYLNKISDLTKQLKKTKTYCTNYQNFASYFLNKNDLKTSKVYLDSSYVHINKFTEVKQICNLYNLYAVYHLLNNEYNKSITYLDKIIQLNPNNEDKDIVRSAFINYSYAYEQSGDFKKANEYLNKYLEINESITEGRIEKKTKELDTKYAIEKLEAKFETTKKRNLLIIFISSFFVLLGIVIAYFYYQNLLLKEKNKIKDLDKELQYKIISATLDGQDEERNKISTVLHDSVSATLSSVGLHLSAFESVLSHEQRADLKKTRSLLKQAHDKVRDLSHELVPPVLVKFGLQHAVSELCEINSNNLLQFEFESNLEATYRFDADFESKMYYIISELMNNIMKHSKATKATISINKNTENNYIFKLTDNGIGFNTADISKSNGFGLTQIKARLKSMNAKLDVKSNNTGTEISIKIKQ